MTCRRDNSATVLSVAGMMMTSASEFPEAEDEDESAKTEENKSKKRTKSRLSESARVDKFSKKINVLGALEGVCVVVAQICSMWCLNSVLGVGNITSSPVICYVRNINVVVRG